MVLTRPGVAVACALPSYCRFGKRVWQPGRVHAGGVSGSVSAGSGWVLECWMIAEIRATSVSSVAEGVGLAAPVWRFARVAGSVRVAAACWDAGLRSLLVVRVAAWGVDRLLAASCARMRDPLVSADAAGGATGIAACEREGAGAGGGASMGASMGASKGAASGAGGIGAAAGVDAAGPVGAVDPGPLCASLIVSMIAAPEPERLADASRGTGAGAGVIAGVMASSLSETGVAAGMRTSHASAASKTHTMTAATAYQHARGNASRRRDSDPVVLPSSTARMWISPPLRRDDDIKFGRFEPA